MTEIKKSSLYFSLIELLIVISIFSLLIVLLISGSRSMLEASRQATCSNQLKQIYFGFTIYVEDDILFPDPYWQWFRLINPRIDDNATMNDPNRLFYCPSGLVSWPQSGTWSGGQGERDLGYSYNTSLGASTYYQKVKDADPSKLILFCDSDDNNITDFALYGQSHLPIQEPGHRHNNGANNIWLDGHISWHFFEELISNMPTWYVPQ